MTTDDDMPTVDDAMLFFDAPYMDTDSDELRLIIGLGRQLAAEVRRLREARADDVALVARLSQQVVALRDAVTRVLDGPHYIDRDYQDVLLDALKGEGR